MCGTHLALLNFHVLFQNTLEKPVSLFLEREKALNTERGSEMFSEGMNSQQPQDLQYQLEIGQNQEFCWFFSACHGIPVWKPCQTPEVTLCVRTMWEGSRDERGTGILPLCTGGAGWFGFCCGTHRYVLEDL